ncbi:hypothetical protein [Bowmanella denitrificans]|uniref:hypothetical protein n=1 Tax=Bowmanella denitrificans TaxID=366582 RepID=UPI000C9AAACD|nr:hypothetical protein [Bowmanella denitrificans]
MMISNPVNLRPVMDAQKTEILATIQQENAVERMQPLLDALFNNINARLMSQEDENSLYDNIRDEVSSLLYSTIKKPDSPDSVRVMVDWILAELQRTDAGSILERINYNRSVQFGIRDTLVGLINGLPQRATLDDLPRRLVSAAQIARLVNPGSYARSSTEGFWEDSINSFGTKGASGISGGWTVIADVGGAGAFIGHMTRACQAGATITVRITIDGVAKTYTVVSGNATTRYVIGNFESSPNIDAQVFAMGSLAADVMNRPCVPFTTSLRVEEHISTIYNVPNYSSALAAYHLNDKYIG